MEETCGSHGLSKVVQSGTLVGPWAFSRCRLPLPEHRSLYPNLPGWGPWSTRCWTPKVYSLGLSQHKPHLQTAWLVAGSPPAEGGIPLMPSGASSWAPGLVSMVTKDGMSSSLSVASVGVAPQPILPGTRTFRRDPAVARVFPTCFSSQETWAPHRAIHWVRKPLASFSCNKGSRGSVP